jgi:hypothetical protein
MPYSRLTLSEERAIERRREARKVAVINAVCFAWIVAYFFAVIWLVCEP